MVISQSLYARSVSPENREDFGGDSAQKQLRCGSKGLDRHQLRMNEFGKVGNWGYPNKNVIVRGGRAYEHGILYTYFRMVDDLEGITIAKKSSQIVSPGLLFRTQSNCASTLLRVHEKLGFIVNKLDIVISRHN